LRPLRPVEPNLIKAAKALVQGDLVVLPTETVYGIAGDASNPDTIERIFQAKGRPADNPLIVHVADLESLAFWTEDIPDCVADLAEAFWPGPLTLVLPKSPRVPDAVTAGLDTVAVRIPNHSATRAIIEATSLGLAMPSANLFMGLSPTRADAIPTEIHPYLAMIIDGGPCRVGIESTVLDLTETPKILRPGFISEKEIEKVLGRKLVEPNDETTRKAPGMYRRHYAPRIPARLTEELGEQDAGLTFAYATNPNQIQMPTDAVNYAKKLYSALANLESRDISEILIQNPPETEEWAAIWNRLRKATATE
jgi:L-threonylcarbamoyladenylate synthase